MKRQKPFKQPSPHPRMEHVRQMLSEDGLTLSPEQMEMINLGLYVLDYGQIQQDRHAYLTAMQLLETHGQRFASQWLEAQRKKIWGDRYADG